jgi:hypothetical protein
MDAITIACNPDLSDPLPIFERIGPSGCIAINSALTLALSHEAYCQWLKFHGKPADQTLTTGYPLLDKAIATALLTTSIISAIAAYQTVSPIDRYTINSVPLSYLAYLTAKQGYHLLKRS